MHDWGSKVELGFLVAKRNVKRRKADLFGRPVYCVPDSVSQWPLSTDDAAPEDGAIYETARKMSSQSQRGNPAIPVKQGPICDLR